MPDFRAYILSDVGQVPKRVESLDCADDDAAVTAAKQLVAARGHDVEVWRAILVEAETIPTTE